MSGGPLRDKAPEATPPPILCEHPNAPLNPGGVPRFPGREGGQQGVRIEIAKSCLNVTLTLERGKERHMSKRDQDARFAWDIATYFYYHLGAPGNMERYEEWAARVRSFGLLEPAATSRGGVK